MSERGLSSLRAVLAVLTNLGVFFKVRFNLVLLFAIFSASVFGQSTYTLGSFDANCGRIPGYNCRSAFQAAFAALTKSGGGTLQLPRGTIFVDFPDLSQNQTWGFKMTRSSLLVVPPSTQILGAITSDGTPATTIQWQKTSVPIFIFNKADGSSMQNVHAQFTGTIPSLYPYGDLYLLQALGYPTAFPHQNQMSGGNAEMFTFFYVFDSNNCTFNNLIFDSASHDNAHIYGSAINVKANEVLTGPTYGNGQLASGHTVSNVAIYDFLGGITISGQTNMLITNITADRRGSVSGLAPGHLLYATASNQFDPNANLIVVMPTTNLTIDNLTEGPDTYSNVVAGGTLAIKGVNGAVINNVVSSHPEGLIQTIFASENVTFSNMTWTSNYDLCGNVPSNCSSPVIYTTPSSAPYPVINNLTFQNISLSSTITPITAMLMGNNLQVQGMHIQTPPTYLPGQKAPYSVLGIKNTASATISGFSYTPLLSSYNANGNYNNPLIGWNPTTNVAGQITVNWSKSLPMPAIGARIISSGFQTTGTAANNKTTTKIVTY